MILLLQQKNFKIFCGKIENHLIMILLTFRVRRTFRRFMKRQAGFIYIDAM